MAEESDTITIRALASKTQVGVSTIYIYLKKHGIRYFKNEKMSRTNCVMKDDVKNIDVLELLKIDETAPKITTDIVGKMLNIDNKRICNIIKRMKDPVKFGGRIYFTQEQVEWMREQDKLIGRRRGSEHKKIKNDDSAERLKILENKIDRLLTELGVKIDDIKE